MDSHFALIQEHLEAASDQGWRAELDAEGQWVRVGHREARTPEQGWKLHVSATVLSSADVLGRALPALLAEPLLFKAATVRTLQTLNDGRGGLSQVGKFLTVYPNDDAQAVRLATVLDRATRGRRGPAVPSDHPVGPGSLISYRYGGFGGLRLRTPLGENLPALRAPDGTVLADRRAGVYVPPPGLDDPFERAGISRPLETPSPLVAGRYLRTETLHQSPRGAVALAVDTVEARPCVVKQARRDATVGRDGRDARDRLRDEAAVLNALAPDPRFPRACDLVSEGDDLYLVLEDVEGETLEVVIGRRKREGIFLTAAQIVAWAQELAAMLGAIHARGYVYADLKSPNVIVAPDGRLRLLDFDSAQRLGASAAPGVRGTRGYMSPQQTAGHAPGIPDDIHALGALLFFMATGAEPSQAPRPDNLTARPLRLLNPALPAELEEWIAGCLAPDPVQRFADTQTFLARTAAVTPFDGAPQAIQADLLTNPRVLAHRVGDTICRQAVWAPGRAECRWHSRHPAAQGAHTWDINTGSGGTLLALAALVSDGGSPEIRATLAAGTAGLRQVPLPADGALPGLYVGEAGAGWALLRAGQALGDASLIDAALARSAWLAAQPFTSPDLFHGTAGRLRFHLWLWQATGREEPLHAALVAGKHLLASQQNGGWRIPDGFGGLSGTVSLGYAHGAAGIADTLLDLFDVTADERSRDAAARSAAWLASLSQPCLADGSGLAWPSTAGGPLAPAFWCHGACGIGQFFRHAAQAGIFPDADVIAARCARAVSRGTRWAGPTLCHGLAGNIEFLLDMHQAMGDSQSLTHARDLGRLLEAFAVETEFGLAWPSENPEIITPDYQVGYAGVAVCLLRLAEETPPHPFVKGSGKTAAGKCGYWGAW